MLGSSNSYTTSASSVYTTSASSVETASLYQAGTQNGLGYQNSAYSYQDSANASAVNTPTGTLQAPAP
jgi:hypothetical protein